MTGWLPLLAAFSVLVIFGYTAAQQVYRQSANDPQTQLAQDIAQAINGGVDPTGLVGTGKIEMTKSLATWLIVVGKDNKVVADNVTLNGKTPTYPTGVLEAARSTGQDVVTWQPESGVRHATVAVKVPNSSGQVVVVGRSLSEVEHRVSQLGLMTLTTWLVGAVGTLVLIWGVQVVTKKSS